MVTTPPAAKSRAQSNLKDCTSRDVVNPRFFTAVPDGSYSAARCICRPRANDMPPPVSPHALPRARPSFSRAVLVEEEDSHDLPWNAERRGEGGIALSRLEARVNGPPCSMTMVSVFIHRGE